MNTIKNKIDNYLSKYSFFIFTIITFLIILNRVPFWDETHAFEIARLKLSEIFYITRIEGHTALWYLILKPFSSLKLYPYPMLFINWLFALGAIFILWKKAPFSPTIKTLITFSVPFLQYYATVARCYSVGILFLFLICAFYKERFKRPLLFASFMGIAANTSVLAAIGTFFMGLLFLFDAIMEIKNKTFSKKNLIYIVLIFLFSALLLITQLIGIRKPELEFETLFFASFLDFTIFPKNTNLIPALLRITTTIAVYTFAFLSFKHEKRGLFFIFGTYLTLTLMFLNIYSGSQWNHFFYFIYFIIFAWIFGEKILKNKLAHTLFFIILFLFLFPMAVFKTGKLDLANESKSQKIANYIIQNKNYSNSKLYILEWWSDVAPGATTYLAQKNVFIYDYHNRKRNSFESLKNIFYMRNEPIDFDYFYQNMDKNGYLISADSLLEQKFVNLIVQILPDNNYIFKTPTKKYLLKQIDKIDNTSVFFYKIYEI